MAFPQTALPIKVELEIDSVWTDVSSDVLERDAVVISRGRTDEGDVVDAGRCSFTLDNRTGKYSPRNPRGAYYGALNRNTPVRVSVEAGSSYLATSGASTEYLSTPDTAALDITGDIDVRVEFSANEMARTLDDFELVGKWAATGNQRSWALWIDEDGEPRFDWSTNGSTRTGVSFDAIAFPRDGRIALRVTLDVDNGSSQHVATLYTSSTIGGTWVEHDSVTVAGTTSIFSSTAVLQLGSMTDFDFAFSGTNGRIYGFELRSSIGGTLVADPDIGTQTPGAASFTGGDGLTWTVNGAASLSNRQIRFHGEVSSWPVFWDVDADDTYVKVEAAGIMRRLGQRAKPLQSTLRRKIPTDASVLAYWPMEDKGDATHAASGLAGGRPMKVSNLDWESADALAGSETLPQVSNTDGAAKIFGTVPAFSDNQWTVEFVYFIETMPSSYQTFLQLETTGTLKQWMLQMNTTGFRLLANYDDGTGLYTDSTHTWTGSAPQNKWVRMKVFCQAFGGSIDYDINWYDVDDTEISSHSANRATSVPGYVTAVGSRAEYGFHADLDGLGIGHIAVFSDSQLVYEDAVAGYAGETSNARIKRLCSELDVPLYLHGLQSGGTQLGAQQPNRFMDLLQEAADADHGILYEERSELALAYQDHERLYNQHVDMALDYTGTTGLVTPLEPVDDDQFLRNDVTVARDGGSSSQVELETGSLSVLDPPDGVGRYSEQVTLNLYEDDQTEQHASWLVHLGTWDETRFPVVNVLLQKATGMIDQALRVDSGSRITIDNPPTWLPPEDIDLMVQGYTELLHQFRWEFTYNCTPARPYNTGVLEDTTHSRADTDGCELVTSVNSSATSMTVLTEMDKPRWIDSATYSSEFPFALVIGGERVTATACTFGASDAFGRTVANAWGTADVGGTWTDAGGVASNFAVGSGVGSHTLTTTNVSRRSSLTAPGADFDVQVDISISALPTGGSMFAGVMARVIDGDNLYMARLEFTTSSTIVLAFRERGGGVEATLGSTSTSPLTVVAGTAYRLRFQAEGTALRARVWLASASEPSVWHVETTDATLTAAGLIGCRSILSSANTNVNPVISYDNFNMLNPQIFTVTRSVNGITKSHTAGAAIALADPTYVAL